MAIVHSDGGGAGKAAVVDKWTELELADGH